ncbi:hypothetical protein BDP27DRAFT_1337665 [Rhodocollybia butyracea]|uniref:Uncharacterized protein n=1 Tax=Rhodocollybia butyracea TaxID=206335 RepID=A0A9P5PEJ9_9AGAR|nr:hypothetical protein BDP27DRAFT_1337665 [Rhodocollybia butyracea]
MLCLWTYSAADQQQRLRVFLVFLLVIFGDGQIVLRVDRLSKTGKHLRGWQIGFANGGVEVRVLPVQDEEQIRERPVGCEKTSGKRSARNTWLPLGRQAKARELSTADIMFCRILVNLFGR